MTGIIPAPRKLRGAPTLNTCGMCLEMRPIVAYRVIRKRLWFCEPCYNHEMSEWAKEVQMLGYYLAHGLEDASRAINADAVDNKDVA